VLVLILRLRFLRTSSDVSGTTQLRKTALNAEHRRLGAKMVTSAAGILPVEYSGILAEHIATRTAAGLFDVSHMGEIEVHGDQALDLVQTTLPVMTRANWRSGRHNIPG